MQVFLSVYLSEPIYSLLLIDRIILVIRKIHFNESIDVSWYLDGNEWKDEAVCMDASISHDFC